LLGKQTDEYRYRNDLGEEPKIIRKMVAEKQTASKFTVLSGIATLADSVFHVERRNDQFYAKTKDGTLYQVEKRMLAAFLKITKQKTEGFDSIGFMIFPYDEDNKIVSEDQFRNDYPMTYAYLCRQKATLAGRDKGKTEKYDAWYAYGRKQGLKVFTDEVILVPSMIGGTSTPIKVNVSSLVEEFGIVLFTSGYVVPVNKNNSKLCDFIFSDDFAQEVKNIGKPWPGGFHSITANQLRSIIPS
jgi:hypothetical protein